MVKIELLSENNFTDYSLDSYVRKQDVKKRGMPVEGLGFIRGRKIKIRGTNQIQ